MKAILIFIGGSGFGKLLPLLFGMYVAKLYGHATYAHLVQILVQANFLTAVSTVSYVQMILRRKDKNAAPTAYATKGALFSMIVSIIGGIWAAYTRSGQVHCDHGMFCWDAISVGIVVALYSLGNSILTTVISQFNAALDSGRAGMLMFVGLLFPYSIGFVIAWFGVGFDILILVIALLLMICAFTAYCRRNGSTLFQFRQENLFVLLRQSIPFEKEHIYIMIFVGTILFSHSYLISKVNLLDRAEQSAIFALGYQLFSIGLFIPNTLGNIVVPRLSLGDESATVSVVKWIGLYLSIALAWLIFVYLLGEKILAWYGVTSNSANLLIMLILQVAVVLGVMNSLLNQKLIADGKLFKLSMFALLYFAILYSWGRWFGFDAKFAAISLVISYASVIIAYGASIFGQRYIPSAILR